MFRVEEIRSVHLEITTKCNAACPQCARNIYGSVDDPSFDLTEIYLDEFKTLFSPEFLAQLSQIFMCGTFGEPAVARDCLEIWKYISACNPQIRTNFHTNGGVRNKAWWAELAQHCPQVWFGIDGLADTNHLYRQNVSWTRLLENVKAFIGAGGNAIWIMNVFKHNQHQVEQCRNVAGELGFKQFIVRKTARFYWPSRGLVSRLPVYTKKGDLTHFLEMPTNPEYLNEKYGEDEQAEIERNTQKIEHPVGPDFIKEMVAYKMARRQRRAEKRFDPKPEISEDVKKKFDHQQICCKAQVEKEIYLSASGLVWPCCFLSVNEWGQGPMQFQTDEMFQKIAGGMETLNFRKHSLEAIVHGEYFQKHVPESWKKSSIETGKLYDCAYWCPKTQGYFASEADLSKLPDSTKNRTQVTSNA